MFVMSIQLEREDIHLQYSDKEYANGSGLLGSDTVAGLVFATY
jgi:hypothetical protein